MSGYIVSVAKDLAIRVNPSENVDAGWVTVFEWDALESGPTILEFELAVKYPNPRPTDVQSRLLRPGNDPTKRDTHAVGTVQSGVLVATYLEFINDGDLPLAFQLWCRGNSLTVVKVIAKALNPRVLIAERLD